MILVAKFVACKNTKISEKTVVREQRVSCCQKQQSKVLGHVHEDKHRVRRSAFISVAADPSISSLEPCTLYLHPAYLFTPFTPFTPFHILDRSGRRRFYISKIYIPAA